MGLAASQARFLAITSRKMNCEFQSMQIAQQKLSVTRDLQKAAEDYQSSLNATKLIWEAPDVGIFDVSYDVMMTPSVLNEFDPFLVTDKNGRVVLTKPMFDAAVNSGIIDEDGNPTGLWIDPSNGDIISKNKNIAPNQPKASGKPGAGPFEELTRDVLDASGAPVPVDPSDPSKGNKQEVYGYKYAAPNRDTADDGSRNAFLYQLGKVNKIDMNMADNIINLGEAGYTKSGIGGKIFSKNSTLAMNTYAFKEYMKKADYSEYIAAGKPIPDGKTPRNLIYEFNLIDILIGNKFVDNPENLDKSSFVITKNEQALSESLVKKLTIGDLLDGKYDITYRQDPSNKYENDAKLQFEKILNKIATALGYNAPNDQYIGLNVDQESDAALNQAYEFTSLALTTVTNKTEESGVIKLCNIADDQNNVIHGKDDKYSLSLTNLLKTFLTNFAIGLEGFDSPYTVKTESAKESNYVTSDLDYKFLFKDESAMTDTLMLNADFYNMLYNQIATCGACTDKTKQELVEDSEWLQQQLKRGSLFISSLNNDGYYYQGAYTLNGHVQEVKDEAAIARAELEYNVQKSKLNTKEESLEIQMKNLDMEISSLTTEYDTVKNLISKGIEKVFTMFST